MQREITILKIGAGMGPEIALPTVVIQQAAERYTYGGLGRRPGMAQRDSASALMPNGMSCSCPPECRSASERFLVVAAASSPLQIQQH